ncbi:hypothetical protein C8Q74DRAFT_1409880 [Fomes fomentarius]|nr:hypothetical protein C8Q74DRAFT_1409880 [Fomes fomentarius]
METSAYAISSPLRRAAFTVSLPPTLYLSGGFVVGEVELDYEVVCDDDIECIYVELQGTLQTKSRLSAKEDETEFQITTSEFLRAPITLWTRERSLPPEDGNAMRLPFEVKLPDDAPPSFSFETYMNYAYVRYALEVTGVRRGTFTVDRIVKLPIVVLQPDPIGSAVRARLKLEWQDTWGRLKAESDMRKLPWGEYGHAKMELLVPHIDAFPLFTDIPYTIIFTTLSAPVKRKGDALLKKDLFPYAPRNPSEIDFELRRFVDMQTAYEPSNPEEPVVDIISKAHAPVPPVDVEVGDYAWIPDERKKDRGRWMQEVTFHSAMNLRFTPTFRTQEIKIKYTLILRYAFPGLGNVLWIELPINIGSGLESSVPTESCPSSPRMVDLPS